MRMEVSHRTAAVLRDVAFRICSRLHAVTFSLFSLHFVRVHIVHIFNCMNTATA